MDPNSSVPDGGAVTAATPSTMNGSDRPPLGHTRARSTDAESSGSSNNINNPQRFPGGTSQFTRDQRAQLARNWSTNHVLQGDGQLAGPQIVEGSAEFGSSWSSGFGVDASEGGGVIPAMPWGSWTDSRRISSASAAPVLGGSSSHSLSPLQPQQHRSASMGGIPTSSRASALLHPSAMHDAARLMDWTRVLTICEQNPASASFVGQQGFTALHHLCSRRCPRADVAEKVILACPDALLMTETNKGWTPLHFASRFKCTKDVVHKLLNLVPEKGQKAVSKPDKQRRPPLWYAVRYDAPPGVVPQLLEVDPSVVLADDLESLFVEIWDKYAESLEGRRALHPYIERNATPEVLREGLARSSKLKKNWKTVNMFLKAAFGFPLHHHEADQDDAENNNNDTNCDRKWRILHATAAVQCHPTMFQLARALYPEQASELDNNDLYVRATGNNGNDEMESRKQTALHLAASSNSSGPDGRAVITELLRMHPEAAHMPDDIDGSYPLHRAAANKHKHHWTFDGINPLYMANPRAVEQVDRNGKLPLHRAAEAISSELEEDIPPQPNNNDDNNDNQDGGAAVGVGDVGTRSVICNLVEVAPQAATLTDNNGCLPFHLVAMNCGGWNEEVQAIYAANERAISTRTGRTYHNSLPIHLAAANPKATKSCIERIVQLNPRGPSQADGRGRMALHLACEQGKHWEEDGLEVIYNTFQQAATMPEENERHWTALHMAAASDKDCTDLIQKLMELHPEACQIQDSEGRLPFHLACEAGKTWEQGLSTLFEGYPAAIATVDNEGRLPLYIVADQYAHAAIERADDDDDLLEEETNNDAAETVELDVLYHLVRSDPTTIPEAS